MGLLDILNGMQNGPRGQRDANSGGMSPITMALLGLLAYQAYKKMTAGQPQASPAGRGPTPLPPGNPNPLPTPVNTNAGAPGGSLGDLLGGLLGGSAGGGLGGPTATTRGGPAAGGSLGDLLGGLLGGGAANPGARAATRSGPAGGGLGDLLAGGLGGLLAGGAAGGALSGGLGDLVKQLQQSGLGEQANSWVGTGPNKAVSVDDLASALGSEQIGFVTEQTGLSQNELLDALSQYLPDVINQLTPDGRLPTDQEISRFI